MKAVGHLEGISESNRNRKNISHILLLLQNIWIKYQKMVRLSGKHKNIDLVVIYSFLTARYISELLKKRVKHTRIIDMDCM